MRSLSLHPPDKAWGALHAAGVGSPRPSVSALGAWGPDGHTQSSGGGACWRWGRLYISPAPICKGLSPWRTDGLMDSLALEAMAVALAHGGNLQAASDLRDEVQVSPEYMGSRFSEPGPWLTVGRRVAKLEQRRGGP